MLCRIRTRQAYLRREPCCWEEVNLARAVRTLVRCVSVKYMVKYSLLIIYPRKNLHVVQAASPPHIFIQLGSCLIWLSDESGKNIKYMQVKSFWNI